MVDNSSPILTGSTTQLKCVKTRLCHFYLRKCCARGEHCLFAHSGDEVRNLPNLAKTKMCGKWKKGQCRHGDSCSYAHGKAELRPLSEIEQAEVPGLLHATQATRNNRRGSTDSRSGRSRSSRGRKNPPSDMTPNSDAKVRTVVYDGEGFSTLPIGESPDVQRTDENWPTLTKLKLTQVEGISELQPINNTVPYSCTARLPTMSNCHIPVPPPLTCRPSICDTSHNHNNSVTNPSMSHGLPLTEGVWQGFTSFSFSTDARDTNSIPHTKRAMSSSSYSGLSDDLSTTPSAQIVGKHKKFDIDAFSDEEACKQESTCFGSTSPSPEPAGTDSGSRSSPAPNTPDPRPFTISLSLMQNNDQISTISTYPPNTHNELHQPISSYETNIGNRQKEIINVPRITPPPPQFADNSLTGRIQTDRPNRAVLTARNAGGGNKCILTPRIDVQKVCTLTHRPDIQKACILTLRPDAPEHTKKVLETNLVTTPNEMYNTDNNNPTDVVYTASLPPFLHLIDQLRYTADDLRGFMPQQYDD